MNCCDEYGNCNRGKDCPVRYACAIEADLRRADRWDRIIGRVCVVLFILALALLWAEHITGGMLP